MILWQYDNIFNISETVGLQEEGRDVGARQPEGADPPALPKSAAQAGRNNLND